MIKETNIINYENKQILLTMIKQTNIINYDYDKRNKYY